MFTKNITSPSGIVTLLKTNKLAHLLEEKNYKQLTKYLREFFPEANESAVKRVARKNRYSLTSEEKRLQNAMPGLMIKGQSIPNLFNQN